MNSNQKQTFCSGGGHYSQTVNQNVNEKVNPKIQKFVKSIEICKILGELKVKFLLIKRHEKILRKKKNGKIFKVQLCRVQHNVI